MFSPVLRRFRGMIALYSLFGIVCAAAAVAGVRLFQMLIDKLTGDIGGISDIVPLLAGYVAVSLFEYVINYLQEYPHNQLRQGMYQFIRNMALIKVSHIDYTAYQDVGTGRLVQLMENGASAGRDILFQFYLNVFTQLLPGAILSVAFIGVYDLRIMFGAVLGYLVVFAITKLMLGKLYSIKEETLISQEWLSKTYVRAMMEMVVFRVNRRFHKEIHLADQAGRQITDANTRIRMVHEFFFAAFAILVLLIKAGIILFGVGSIISGDMTVGVLIALLTLVDRVYQPIAIFNVEYVDLKLNRVAWERFADFLRKPDDPNLLGGKAPTVTRGEITLEEVTFSYGDRVILNNLSISFPAGKTTALVGRSGAGKSTVLCLAMGLLKPQKGRVLLDGQDMALLDMHAAYGHIAYISQDAPVFDGTIRENILFDETSSDEDVFAALQMARLDGLIANLPDGLDTAVGEHGIKLSGGEKQRLAFARVFYQKPRIIVLDEPTSALDKQTEAELVAALRNALPDRTILLIAHSPEGIAAADNIIRLEDGGDA